MEKIAVHSSLRGRNMGTECPPPSPLRAFNLARDTWVKGKRISFENLSKVIGVSRVTLYRWQGSKDQLIEDIIWSFAEPVFNRIRSATPGKGISHIVEVHRRFLMVAARFTPMRRFIQNNPTTSIRIQAMNVNTAHGRLIEATTKQLAEQESLGHIQLNISARDLAELIVTTNCALLYTSIIRDESPSDVVRHACTITYNILHENTKLRRSVTEFEEDEQYEEETCQVH